MSTLAKGNAFEDRVHSALHDELKAERLGLSPATATTFKKKGYYSKDRDAEIIVDVSIEVWLPNAPNWSFLWVCECKDYSGTIPVDDVEEFKAKLDQISGANRKGVIVTSQALQTAALKYARANGIGVVRLLPDDQVQWVSYLMTAQTIRSIDELNPSEFRQALTVPSFVGRNRGFYAASDGYIFGGWSSLLRHGLKP